MRSTNFGVRPSLTICTRPSATTTSRPPELKVPTKTTFLAFWLMSMKPPQPGMRLPNLLAFTLPSPSHSPKPRNAASSPPPSMKSKAHAWSITAS